ncbi:interferon a3-like [Chaetodon trifascialis]|uniref:interferon a3-like n=1 Tax=Chaetodon trifascialis TaxID=109706 RepID=UPI003992AEAB
MLYRILFVCLALGVLSAASPLRCRWVTEEKFKEHSKNYLKQLNMMASNSTNTTGAASAEDTVAFPDALYSQASEAADEDKLAFAVQILEGVAALFEEDHSSASWEEVTMETFVNVVTQQADSLRSCLGSHNPKNMKLQRYFTRLSRSVLKKLGHSAEAWELIREQVKRHLMSTDLLISPQSSVTV